MATFYLSPLATFLQLLSDTGVPLSGALIWTYAAGTSTPTPTWTDATGVTENSNPIQLLSNGRLATSIWQEGGVAIKVQFSTNAGTVGSPVFGTQIGPTFDQVQGINDFTLADSALANPASGMGADLVANAMRSYDVFATARAANVPVMGAGQTLIVDFEGGVTINDQLGGLFYWNATSSASDDGLNVIAPTGLSAGRYLRLDQYLKGYAVKPGTTSIATNTTVANDPDLQIPIPTGGTYAIELWLNDASGTSAGGLKGQVAYSGTVTAGFWGMNGTGTTITTVKLTALGTTAELQSAQAGDANLLITGMLQCTNSGTLSFKWAQNSSSGTSSVVAAGSWMRVTRLSSTTGSFTPTTHSYNVAGSGVETIPVGASYVAIEAWGGPGGGNKGSGTGCAAVYGPGGASGGYSYSTYAVGSANGQTIDYVVGALGSALGGAGTLSSVSSGTFTLATMTANGGGGGSTGGSAGTGGVPGTASGGNTTNTTGNAGVNGNSTGLGGVGISGINGTGAHGGRAGLGSTNNGLPGAGPGLVIFKYT